MAIEIPARTAPNVNRLAARSFIANADVELARRTLAPLKEQQLLEDAGERFRERLRRIVAGSNERDSRS